MSSGNSFNCHASFGFSLPAGGWPLPTWPIYDGKFQHEPSQGLSQQLSQVSTATPSSWLSPAPGQSVPCSQASQGCDQSQNSSAPIARSQETSDQQVLPRSSWANDFTWSFGESIIGNARQRHAHSFPRHESPPRGIGICSNDLQEPKDAIALGGCGTRSRSPRVLTVESHVPELRDGVVKARCRAQNRGTMQSLQAARRLRLSKEINQIQDARGTSIGTVVHRRRGRAPAKTQMPILVAKRMPLGSANSEDEDRESEDSVASVIRATKAMKMSPHNGFSPSANAAGEASILETPPRGNAATFRSLSPMALSQRTRPPRLEQPIGTPRTAGQFGSESVAPPVVPANSPSSQLLHTPSPVGHRDVQTPPRRTPPPRPCHRRRRTELNNEINIALESHSPALLSMALLRDHDATCVGEHELHEAINLRHVRALEYLLVHCDKDIEEPCNGIRPLLRAVRSAIAPGDAGHDMVHLLLQHGADPNVPGLDEDLDWPVHHAARRGHVELTAWLLAHGADPNQVDNNGYTALHAACHQMFSHWDERIVDVLLARGADPRRRDTRGRTPHHHLTGQSTMQTRIRLEREIRWWERRAIVLAYNRTCAVGGDHVVCRLPFLLFQLMVKYL